MRKTLPVTITLDRDAVTRINDLCGTFGGKVVTFAASWAERLSHLDPDEIRTVEQLVKTLSARHEQKLSSLTE